MWVLEVNNLKTYYFTLIGKVRAVDDVSFKLKEGEALGLVGESACGKTTTVMSLMRLISPPGRIVSGQIILDGKSLLKVNYEELRKIRWKKISMVFQSAMNALNPVFKIEDQIAEAILTHEKTTKEDVSRRVKQLIEMVGIDSSKLEQYPHELSGGMKQRVVIAMALANFPRIVILDEPTTALDVITQAQILRLIKNLQEEMGLSILFITHDLSVIAETCDRVAVMYAGKIVENSDVKSVLERPKHPYSKGLIESFPTLSRSRQECFSSIPGAPPNLVSPPRGCRFYPRCPERKDICKEVEPPTIKVGENHLVACHLYL